MNLRPTGNVEEQLDSKSGVIAFTKSLGQGTGSA